MFASVRIVEAVETDVEDLVAIFCDAMEEDIISRFMFGHRRVEAVKKQTEFFTPNLRKRFTHPTNRCHIVKAIDESSNKTVGWSLVRWEDGNPVEPPKSTPDQPDFLMYYWYEQDKNWRKLTAGKEHIVLGSLYVHPDHQRRGIGTQLVEHLFKRYELEQELVFVQTLASSEGFYTKFGWVTADSTDVDLSKWGGSDRGYGLHRAPQMLRRAAPLRHP